jgi:hypothetical protein
MHLPTKRDCFYLLEMLHASLIDFRYLDPWAEKLILGMDAPPFWLCELATKQSQGDLIKALGDFVSSKPSEPRPEDMEKFHLGCLWLRYERREISWATFLRFAGEYLDGPGAGDWQCETPYHYLTKFEDAHFSEAAEKETKRKYLASHDLAPWIEKAREKFKPFEELRKENKSRSSMPQE